MKKLALIGAALAFASPSIANATCIARGHITQTIINPGDQVSSFYVTPTVPGDPTFLFVTTDSKIITAVVAAYGSGQVTSVTGSAATCGAPISGISNAGAVLSFQVP